MTVAPMPITNGRSGSDKHDPPSSSSSSAPTSPARSTRSGGSASGGRHHHRQHANFGPYRLHRTLGEGEFGKVKLAVHLETGKEVAIKLIKKENIESPSRRSKLMREISILQAVDHPFIVKLIEVIETEQYIGMIMEYASGGELFEHILAHRYLKEREACRFFAQLIAGVNYLHSIHIVHRDLKLENLLLDGNRNIIITDFGFANRSSRDGESMLLTSCGSPCYAAPELVISDGYVGEAADIWSCGVILYAMLCGYLPFDDDPQNPDGDNINLLYKYILETELDFPDYVSEDARDLLRHIWLAPYADYFEEPAEEEPEPMDVEEASTKSYTTPPATPTPNQAYDMPSPTPSDDHLVPDVVRRTPSPPVDVASAPATIAKSPSLSDAMNVDVTEVKGEGRRESQGGEPSAMDVEPVVVASNGVGSNAAAESSEAPIVPDVNDSAAEAASAGTGAGNRDKTVSTDDTQSASRHEPKPLNSQPTPPQSSPPSPVPAEESASPSRRASDTTIAQPAAEQEPTTPTESANAGSLSGAASSRGRRASHDTHAARSAGSRGRSVGRDDGRNVAFTPDSRKRQGKGPDYGRKSLDVRRTPSKNDKGVLGWFKKSHHSDGHSSPNRRPASAFIENQDIPPPPPNPEPLPRPSMAPTVFSTTSEYTLNYHHTHSRPSKPRFHHGPIDQRALSSKHPAILIADVAECLAEMGMDVRHCEEYKLKVLRPRVPEVDPSIPPPPSGPPPSNSSRTVVFDEGAIHEQLESRDPNAPTIAARASVDSMGSRNSGSKDHKERERKRRGAAKLASIIASFPVSLVRRLRYLAQYGPNYNKGFTGKEVHAFYGAGASEHTSYSDDAASVSGRSSRGDYHPRPSVSTDRFPVYSHQPRSSTSIPPSTYSSTSVNQIPPPPLPTSPGGALQPSHPASALLMEAGAGEIRFVVEIQRIKNLPGLFVVEFKRLRGDIWAFKRLYQDAVHRLRLKGVGDF
ncbi:hypothetical protein HK104_007824 [Borealophlyctis nickersoniae]|nr:hypothetical protein HK104_007824 [Borealophlyctis nickersoniae]